MGRIPAQTKGWITFEETQKRLRWEDLRFPTSEIDVLEQKWASARVCQILLKKWRDVVR